MNDPVTLKDLLEIWFSFFPTAYVVQWADVLAIIINAVLDAVGIDFKVIGF